MSEQPPVGAGAQWDARFSGDGYVYGTEPNAFLRETASRIPAGGRVASLGDGEGRNGVYLATQGYSVLSVDASAVGLAKARKLAETRGVTIETVQTDLKDFAFPPEPAWDGAVLIFCHLPPALRAHVHRCVAHSLKPGGVVILEAYSPRQLEFGTGGPKIPELLYTTEALKEDFAGLDVQVLQEITREVKEGTLHTGTASVVQVVARRPGA